MEAPRNSEEEDFIITLIFMVIIGRRAPPVLEAGARNFMMQLLTIWQGSSSVLAFLAPVKKRTFLSTPVHELMAQHERGDIYIPGFDGSVLGSQTIIDVVRTHAHTKT